MQSVPVGLRVVTVHLPPQSALLPDQRAGESRPVRFELHFKPQRPMENTNHREAARNYPGRACLSQMAGGAEHPLLVLQRSGAEMTCKIAGRFN